VRRSLLPTGCLAAAALLLPLVPAAAEFQILNWLSEDDGSSEVRITSCFDRTPHRGYLPVRVTLRNARARERNWILTFHSGHGQPGPGGSRVQSRFRLSIAPGASTEHDLLVPLPALLARNRSTSLRAVLSDGREDTNGYLQPHQHNSWLTLAISQDLAGRDNLESLSERIRAREPKVRSSEPAAIIFDPATLPVDWRGFSGIDVLLLSLAEWDRLSPALRGTVLDWMRLGNRLVLLQGETSSTRAAEMAATEPPSTRQFAPATKLARSPAATTGKAANSSTRLSMAAGAGLTAARTP